MNSGIQVLSFTEIFQSAWEDAKVKEEKEKSFYCIGIIWGHLLDALQLLSKIALTVLTVPHSNGPREQVFFIIRKNNIKLFSTLNLGKSLNSIILIKISLPRLSSYSSRSKQQSTETND